MAEKEHSKNGRRTAINLRKNNFLGKRITINVSGLRYETFDKTLERFPDSLLGSKERRDEFFDSVNNEYFFDRNRICFESILAYYQTCGVLIRPPNIPRKVFYSDIKYFDLGEQALKQAGDDIEVQEREIRPMPKNKLQRKIWSLFEHPDTSNGARVIAIFSVTVIVLSIVLFCVETLPQFQRKPLKVLSENSTEKVVHEDPKKSPFFAVESFCIAWFTIEYVVRFLCCPNKCKFVVSVLNVIDLVAILPFFITLPMEETTSVSSLAVLRCVRLVRVFRIFKLSRYSRGLQILGHTLKASLRELGLLFFFLCVGVILFSSAVYYAEFNNTKDNAFLSIPHSFWWSIITMTTVGYGDMVPQTLGGKLVGCFCAITGVLAIALPVPVIVSNFAYYYSREHSKNNNSGDFDEETEEEEDKEVVRDVEAPAVEAPAVSPTSASPRLKYCRCGQPQSIFRRRKKKKMTTDSDICLPEIRLEHQDSDAEMDCKNRNIQNNGTVQKNTQIPDSDKTEITPMLNGNKSGGKKKPLVEESEESGSRDDESSETEPFLSPGIHPTGQEPSISDNKLFMADPEASQTECKEKKADVKLRRHDSEV